MSSTTKKAIFISCGAFILNLTGTIGVFLAAPKFTPKNMSSDLSLLVLLFLVYIPFISIITGIVSQLTVKRIWASPIITAVTVIIGAPVALPYSPVYVTLSFAASALTFLAVKITYRRKI